MPDRRTLNLIIAVTILIITIWLTWATRTWDSAGQLLQAFAIALVTWTLLEKQEKPATLLEFAVESLAISFAATTATWFTSLGLLLPLYFTLLGTWGITSTLTYILLPRSLLSVAVSIIIYGTFKTKLKPWQILLTTWYTSIYAVSAAYTIWWAIFIQPYLQHIYTSGAGAIALDMLLAVLALIPATIFSIIYLTLKRTREETVTITQASPALKEGMDTHIRRV